MHDIAVLDRDLQASNAKAKTAEKARKATKYKLRFVEAMVEAAAKVRSKCLEK